MCLLGENDIDVRMLCLEDLIHVKEAAGRPQDLDDAQYLRAKTAAQ